MTCESFLEALSREAPASLGTLDDEHREHAAGCSTCAARLSAVESGLARLGAALSEVGPGFTEDVAVELATGGTRRLQSGRRTSVWTRWSTAPRLRWTVIAGAPAVALVWFVLSITGGPQEPLAAVVRVASLDVKPPVDIGAEALADTEEVVEPAFSIAAPDSGRVAVFQTSNPKIRVVWFYDDAADE